MVKKILKITGISLAAIILILALAPVLFKGKIMRLIKENVNKNITATFDFENVSISLLRSFPKASVSISQISIINKAPFKGDTLFAADKIAVKMSVKELFKKAGKPMAIQSFSVDGAHVNILFNEDGAANYDIAKKTTEKEEESSPLTLSVADYKITNSHIVYWDKGSDMKLVLAGVNHSGSGDLSTAQSKLTTHTDAQVTFVMDSTAYLANQSVKLDAVILMDLAKSRYSFLDNKALVNQLPLVFNGYVQVNKDNQEVDISFKTPSSDFKNFLGVIPAAYSKNIENVQTSGNFMVDGVIKGIVDSVYIPAFQIKMFSEDASFKYPNLPKAVSNIHILAEVGNKTGLVDDTYIAIDKISFKIDEDVFTASAKIQDLMKNPYITAAIAGRINLANLSKAYPVELKSELRGMLEANIRTAFDMLSIEKKRYENTRNEGTLGMTGFRFASPEMAHPVEIDKAHITFTTKTVTLDAFSGKTGQSDFQAKGTLHNPLGFLLKDEKVEGVFNLSSRTFAVNDFMTTTPPAKTTAPPAPETQGMKIPAFLDAALHVTADRVLYDNLTLKNVKGTVTVKDQKASLTDVSSQIFDGQLGLKGSVSTKEAKPVFDMSLQATAFDIASSFKELQLFQFLTPLADALNGKLNASISLSGNLKDDLTPQLLSVGGELLGELLQSSFNSKNSKLLQSFDQSLDFINLSDLNLENLKAALSFKDGKVIVKPFHIRYKDIDMEVSGSHGFDKSLSYSVKLNVPAKYLGKEASGLLSQLTETEAQQTLVPVNVTLGGNFTNPSVKTDLKSAVAGLTQQIAAKQKEKLVGKGKEELAKMLTGGKETPKDSAAAAPAKQDAVKQTAKNVLGNLFGKKKKDTVN